MIYVAKTALVTGDVAIGRNSSVWHGAVVRGDFEAIVVGRTTNIQDNAVVHNDVGNPCIIGDRVTVGHGAIVHGCLVGDECLVGMGSIITSHAKLGRGSILAAGAVVPEGVEIPPNSIAVGIPARVIGQIQDHHRLRIELSWRGYASLGAKSLPARKEMKGNPAKRVRFDMRDELEGKF